MRLAAHGIKIPKNNWIDIQDLINFNGQGNRTRMADLASVLIDPSFIDMKRNFPSTAHDDWEVEPLPNVNLKYAMIDGYVSYKLHMQLTKINEG
jgi:ribonuclease D